MLKGLRIVLFYLGCLFIALIIFCLITLNIAEGIQPIYYVRASKALFPCIIMMLPFLLVDLRK